MNPSFAEASPQQLQTKLPPLLKRYQKDKSSLMNTGNYSLIGCELFKRSKNKYTTLSKIPKYLNS